MIENKNVTDSVPESGESDQGIGRRDGKFPDRLSQKILKKWQSGVIICIWPKLFWNEDDIEMK